VPPLLARNRRAALFALVGLFGWFATTARGQVEAEGLSASFRKAARRALPAVVTVRPTGVPNPFEPAPGIVVAPFAADPNNPRPPRDAGGSGVVIDAARGLVLTNDHVIQGANRVVVVLGNGRERAVKQAWRDPKSDLAVLSVDPSGLVQADWGDSEGLDIGDWVLAVGQPFGLSGTVTAGIVSGKGRGIGMALYEDLIQTDAAINPGNSGGPLVNLRGEVVGINTAIKTNGGGYEGVGFAVPSSRARRVAADLAEFGRVRRAYLGVTIRPVGPSTAERLDNPGAATITGVAVASPAADAGLRPGDVILQIGGKPAGGPGPLQAAIEVAKVGEPLNLVVDRAGQVFRIDVRPESQPDRYGLPGPPPVVVGRPPGGNINVPGGNIVVPGPNVDVGPAGVTVQGELEPPLNPGPPPAAGASDVIPGRPGERPPIRSRPSAGPEVLPPAGPQETVARSPTRFPEFGLRLAEPTPDLIRRFRFDREPRGLIVTGVEPDGPADRGGLEIGMVITDAGGRKVANLTEFREAAATRPAGRDLLIRIAKGSKSEFRVIVDPSGPANAGADPGPDLKVGPRPDPPSNPDPKAAPDRGPALDPAPTRPQAR